MAAIACALAGAAAVEAVDIDPFAAAAARLNAGLNGACLAVLAGDLVGCEGRWDLIVCGDVCYEAPMTRRILPWLRRLAADADVWIADPERGYLPREGSSAFAEYRVPTTLELEGQLERIVTLYLLQPIGPRHSTAESLRA